MTKVMSFSGVTVEAAPDEVPRLLKSGMFRLCEGEEMPPAEPEPEDVAVQDDTAEEEGGFALEAFGGEDEGEDLASLTNAQLREICAERGIDVPPKANKAKLLSLIEEA